MGRKRQVIWAIASVAILVLIAGLVGLAVSSSWGPFIIRLAPVLGTVGVLATALGPAARWLAARMGNRDLLQRNVARMDGRGRMPKVRDDGPAWPEIHKSFPLRPQPGASALHPILPTYVPRDVDLDVDQAIGRGGLIILEGAAASGLSLIFRFAQKRTAPSYILSRSGRCNFM